MRKPICVLVVALLLTAGRSFSQKPGAATFQQQQDQVDIQIDGKPFTTYYVDPQVAKPYFMPLRTAAGLVITRAFPVRNDVSMGDPKASSFEPHQRPMYFGHGDIDGLDFWGEEVFNHFYDDHGAQAYGHAKLKKLEPPSVAGDRVRLHAGFQLLSPEGRVIGEETQDYQLSGDATTRSIECDITLEATHGPLDLGDSKEGTFAIRLAPELSGAHANMINSQGAHGEKEIWGKRANWVAYSGKISGSPAGVAIFDSPRSFRHPTTWHARAYGLFAANPFGLSAFTHDPVQNGSVNIPEGKALHFRYRVLIYDGAQTADQLERAYQTYAALEQKQGAASDR